jgi:hypothetical protein
MIAVKDVLLMLADVELSSQHTHQDNAAAAAARLSRSVQMPSVVRVDAGQSSAGLRHQRLAVGLSAIDAIQAWETAQTSGLKGCSPK